MNISIIGAGNMAGAIAKGLLKKEVIQAQNLFITRRSPEKLREFEVLGCQTDTDNQKAVEFADIVVFGTKPWDLEAAIGPLKETLNQKDPIVISVASGWSPAKIQSTLKLTCPVFVCMPNTGISQAKSATAIQSIQATQEQTDLVKNLFDKLGSTLFVTDKQMRSMTVLSGSGTAFALRYIRAYTNAGIQHGLKPHEAKEVAIQVMEGALALLRETKSHPEELIDKVTTPGGCTIAGLNEMESAGFSSSIFKMMNAGVSRVKEMENDK